VERIHAVMAEIQQAPARPVTVAALARRHGYSVSHFSRLFAAIAGRRPQAFVIEARLEQARERLAFTEESVGAIAAQCGFADIYYFSRLFRQRTGVPPTEYRRRLARS
jgi:transcriptional regulator GlxA family with amidase domain